MSFLYLFLAAFGLGFLVFIHELGHYFMAKHVKIKIEAFSIGFGKPIISWMRGDVQWRVGWLPFGGYVRMAGMDKQEGKQPYEVEGGFFHARPIDRIKVALAGPIVNLVFGFLLFTAIWAFGGRDKPFSDLTNRVGWVDESSSLYEQGLRPGDEIVAYDGRELKTSQDHLYAAMLGGDLVRVQGNHINYRTGKKTPFDIEGKVYPHPQLIEDEVMTLGVAQPAQYLLYQPMGHSVVEESGIKPGDRLLWADGELLFSQLQLSHILNEKRALLTVQRKGQEVHVRVPRVPANDLLLSAGLSDEIADWHYDASFPGRATDAQFIAYNLTPEGVVEGDIPFIDRDRQEKSLLLPGDKIIAVDGEPVQSGADILKVLQTHEINFIVQRKEWPIVPGKEADENFDRSLNWTAIDALGAQLGTPAEKDGYALLKPVAPITVEALATKNPEMQKQLDVVLTEIEKIGDPTVKREALEQFEAGKEQLVLGIQIQDRQVLYNPLPTTLFANTILETGRTLKALVTGDLSPKFLSGPVGIIQVMHYGWSLGVKEALFWLAIISLNLGFLNLLPIPVLDGGHICFSLWEMITKKRLKAETMEKLIIPFVVLLIGFFIFATYQDLSRLFRGFF